MTNLCESLASEALKTCIFGSVKNVYSSIKNYKGNLKLLKDNMELLSSKKDDIVRKVEVGESVLEEVTNEATVWLQHVKALLEDEEVNDLLNDELRKAKDQCCFGIFLCNLYHRYGMSRLAKSKADEIKEKLTHVPQDPVTIPKRIMDLDPIPIQHCKALDSRGMVEQRILELLKDDEVDAVGICGMGGVGKTTLAKDIKNKGAKDMFDIILMVEISQVVNIERIQDHIAASINLSLDSKHSLEQRATKLYNALKQMKSRGINYDQPKKILIIMDNIWTDLKLDEVGIPHERTPQFCCKILFTSRQRRVCTLMGVPDENIVDVSILGKDESRSLFWEQIRNVDGSKVEKSLVDRLLRSCGGLPLAIVTLAKSLSGQKVSMWLHFADELENSISCRSNNVVHHEGAYKVLEASYASILSDEKKMFFLLACLYPFGSGIPIEKLMQYGIGLNLFWSANSLTEIKNKANIWTDELISSFLLLEDDKEYGLRRVKVHDVVRSCAILLCVEKDEQKLMVDAIPRWQFDESWEKYTAISLSNYNDFSRLRGMRFDMLETLILKSSRYFELGDHDDLFQGMARLKVLQLSRLRSCLPKSITTLTHLRTLQLEDCTLEDGDMEMISELVGLVVLSLRGSNVKTLPSGMKNLSHLRLLDLHHCWSLKTIPANVIGNLTQLEGLYMLARSKIRWRDNSRGMEQDTIASIAELRLLRCLKVLEIQVQRIEQVTKSDMEFITSLQEFKFYDNLDNGMTKFSSVNFEVGIGYSLEWLRKYPCLKTLLANSNQMKISDISHDEGLLKNVVPNLDREGLQVLEELQLYNLKGLKRIFDGQVPPHMFSNLRTFKLESLENLESCLLPIDVAPNLTTLSIKKCKRLKFIWMENVASFTKKEYLCLKYLKLDTLPNLIHALGSDDRVEYSASIDINKPQALFNINKTVFPSLEELEVVSNSMYENLLVWDIPNPMQEMSARMFFNLRRLTLSNVYNLVYYALPIDVAPNLTTLTMRNCKKLKYIWMENDTQKEIYKLSCLKHLELSGLDNLIQALGNDNINNSSTYICINNLFLFNTKTIFPSLEVLSIYYNSKYEKLMQEINARTGPHLYPFPNLRKLYIKGANNMKIGIGSPSIVASLVHLETLQIMQCEQMTQVISEEIEEETKISSNTITFPKLQLFELIKLEKLECMYGGSYKVEFPALKKMKLLDVPSMTRFVCPDNTVDFLREKVEFPSLEELTLLGGRSSMMNLYSSFQTLRVLKLDELKWKHAFSKDMVATIGLTQLNHLEQLYIRHCENMEAVVEEIDDEAMPSSSSSPYLEFPRLRFICLSNCSKLRWFFSTRNTQTLLHLPSLEDLYIEDCTNMELFTNGPIMVPKLAQVRVERSRPYTNFLFPMADGGDINNILHNSYKYFHS